MKPKLIVPFPDLSFCVQWSQQIMHYLGVCLSICMSWNIGHVTNLSQGHHGKVTKWFSALFGSLLQFVVAKKQRFVVRVGAAHVAPSIASLGQLRGDFAPYRASSSVSCADPFYLCVFA
jgi:hypothetical protein